MSASSLKVKWTGRVKLAGPARSEVEARTRLEEQLYDILSQCYYLDDSGRAAYYAEKITAEVPYRVAGTKIVVAAELNVLYKNPPLGWKWWGRIQTDDQGNMENMVTPGEMA